MTAITVIINVGWPVLAALVAAMIVGYIINDWQERRHAENVRRRMDAWATESERMFRAALDLPDFPPPDPATRLGDAP